MYPTWEGVGLHSTMYVAFIAVFHVIASHLTVGAAWFNVYVEHRALHEDRPELYEYLRKSARGLLVFAYVFGAMAGVGIWQSTTAANPRGISALIHNFVLFWGSEWYMFMIDVLGIVVYYYTLGKVDRRTHLRLAWILALGGTGTLSLIVGILGFKVTPGMWLETGEPLDGFYNPTFWPQFFMRLLLMLAITGVWAILICSRLPRRFPERQYILRWASLIGLGGLSVAIVIGRVWYYPNLSESAGAVLGSQALPAITPYAIFGGTIIVAAGLLYAAIAPDHQTRMGTLGLFAVLFAAIFAAERTREIGRKPDVVKDYISSNQLVFNGLPARGITSDEARVDQNGAMAELPFVATPAAKASTLEEGRMLAISQCSGCHSVSDQTVIKAGDNQLALRQQSKMFARISVTDADGIDSFTKTIGDYPFMHHFVGTDDERRALAEYIESMVQHQQSEEAPQTAKAGE